MEKPIFKKALPEKKVRVNNKEVAVQLLAEFFYDQDFDTEYMDPMEKLQLSKDIDAGDAYPALIVLTARVGEVEGTTSMGGFLVILDGDSEEEILKQAMVDYKLDEEAIDELVNSLNTHFEKLGVEKIVKATRPGVTAKVVAAKPRVKIDLTRVQPVGTRVQVKREFQFDGPPGQDRTRVATIVGHEWNDDYDYVDSILQFSDGLKLPFGPHEIIKV